MGPRTILPSPHVHVQVHFVMTAMLLESNQNVYGFGMSMFCVLVLACFLHFFIHNWVGFEPVLSGYLTVLSHRPGN